MKKILDGDWWLNIIFTTLVRIVIIFCILPPIIILGVPYVIVKFIGRLFGWKIDDQKALNFVWSSYIIIPAIICIVGLLIVTTLYINQVFGIFGLLIVGVVIYSKLKDQNII